MAVQTSNIVDILYLLDSDLDGYWIAYDFKLQNDIADIDCFTIPWVLFGYGGSRSNCKSGQFERGEKSTAGGRRRSSCQCRI
jgi:hypothetical protein